MNLTRRALLAVPATALAQAPPAKLPPLPYAFSALEPHLDARTMEIHHGKHHQAYVDNLNKALSMHPQAALHPLDHLLSDLNLVPEAIRSTVRNHGGGHWNHSLFWQTLTPKKTAPTGAFAKAITQAFGSQAAFETKLQAAGLGVFGSGWVWLTRDPSGAPRLETSPNQDNPLMAGRKPVFGIDVWEHAYYLKYQNRRADYLAAVLKVLDWEFISQRYADAA